jgi:hypothetical protein
MGAPDRQAPANPLSLRLAMDRRVSGAFLRGRQRQGSPDRRAHNSSASRKLAAAPLEEGANPLCGIFAAHQLGLLGIELADRRVRPVCDGEAGTGKRGAHRQRCLLGNLASNG